MEKKEISLGFAPRRQSLPRVTYDVDPERPSKQEEETIMGTPGIFRRKTFYCCFASIVFLQLA